MSSYRNGTVLGLTVAEVFILLTFLLILALLGLIQPDEPLPESHAEDTPMVWVRPDKIETLINSAKQARKEMEQAERALAAVEQQRDQAHGKAEEARKKREEAEQALATAKHERDQANEKAKMAHDALEGTEQALANAERQRDQAKKNAEESRRAQEETLQALADLEHERNQAQSNLEIFRRKGKNPPCWYQIVAAGEGKTREKPYYAFNVAIYEDSIELAPRTAPPGGALDDGGGLFVDEWKRLHIDELPYGKALNDNEFIQAVRHFVVQGKNRQVRTYECVFSVMVWDKTPGHAKERWKDAHDRVIEGSFSAYTVRDLEWKSVN